MLDFDSDAGTHGQFRPPTADRQMLLAMERSDVYVIKPAAPQLPWEFYRNMLPDVPQQSQNALARSSLPTPPLQRPHLVAHCYELGPRGEPSPRGCQREAAAALWCLPNAADITFEHLQALPCLFVTVAATGLLTAYLVSVSFARDFAVAPPRVAVVSKSRTR